MTSSVQIGITRTGATELTRRWRGENRWASLLIVHGLGEHSGRYERLGGSLARAGMEVFGFDLPGHGASGGRRADLSSWNSYLEQVADNLGRAREAGLPVVLLGHSLGGLIAVSYTRSRHPRPDLVVLSAPALGANLPAWKRWAAPLLGGFLPGLPVPNRIRPRDLSRDPAVGEAYRADPLTTTRTRARLGAMILERMETFRLSQDDYDAPTLLLHGGDDEVVPPAATARLGELRNVERRVYPGLRHEIFNEPEGPQLAEEMIAWIRGRVG